MAALPGYSSFFSSGLLASHPGDGNAPSVAVEADPTTPRAHPRTLEPEPSSAYAGDKETTPTPADPLPASASSNNVIPALLASPNIVCSNPNTANVNPGSSPRLRRRRSSLGVAASPVPALKASAQRAPAAVRNSLRARAGSIGENALVARTAALSVTTNSGIEKSNMGASVGSETPVKMRLRSGSVGAALRPRRARRHPAALAPAPPPTVPLPALPTMPSSSLDAKTASAARRPSLARRSHTADAPLTLPMHAHGVRSLDQAHPHQHGVRWHEDYPSPLDTPAEARDDYFGAGAGDVVMAL